MYRELLENRNHSSTSRVSMDSYDPIQNHVSPDWSLGGEFQPSSVQSGAVKPDAVPSRGTPRKTEGNHGFSGGNVVSWRSGRVVECAGLENRKHSQAIDVPTDSYDPAENHLSPDLSLNMTNHPELAILIRAWPDLPEALRAGILAMVKSSH